MLELLQHMEGALICATNQGLLALYCHVRREDPYLRQSMGVLTPSLNHLHLLVDFTNA